MKFCVYNAEGNLKLDFLINEKNFTKKPSMNFYMKCRIVMRKVSCFT